MEVSSNWASLESHHVLIWIHFQIACTGIFSPQIYPFVSPISPVTENKIVIAIKQHTLHLHSG